MSLKFIREHFLDVPVIRFAYDILFPEIPFSFCTLLGQDMAFVCFTVKYFFLACHFEPFLGSLVCL